MKKFLLFLFMLCGLLSEAQVYNNEWIDYSKTYYKFKLGKTGVHRIPASVLASSGLSATPAEQLQLWRHGVQVPIYTSNSTGPLAPGGYIEFWGEANDGKADKELYRNPDFQLNDKYSLSSDSSVYFLTINTTVASNLRLIESPNNVSTNTLPAESWFMYTRGVYFRDRINNGYAVNVGEYLYSSTYDKGEGYSSNDIVSNATPTGVTIGSNTQNLTNLFVSPTGPDPSFILHVSGNMVNARSYKVYVNFDSIMGNSVDFFNYAKDTTTFPLSKIVSGSASVIIENHANVTCFQPPGGCQLDRMVIHKYEMVYPRQFNFGGSSNFEFFLPATALGYYLEIQNFNYGSSIPVLYDLTDGKRYLADLSAAPQLKFVLPPSTSVRKLVLVSEEASNLNIVSSLTTRNFIDYTQPSMAGDFLIISNPILFGTGAVNPVEEYRAYRSSVVGGGHNAKIYLADEIVDQFGFGIHKFAGAIRNFLRYARLNYPVTPKNVFIIGHGIHYLHQRTLVTPDMDKLNLVPTFGWPASDILLTAEPGSSIPNIPIGRLSVINAEEVQVYLSKVKEYEQTQKISSPTIADKDWMKNVVHIIGASDNVLTSILANNMNNYKKIIQDTLFGGKVSTFTKNSSEAVQQLSNGNLVKLFSDGISLITYFGHSSASTLEFNLENPQNYNNQGKYPLFVGLGCNAGNFFSFNGVRFITKETISEKYVLAPNRGTIGFIASSHFGLVHYLDIWNSYFYKRLARSNYGRSIGEAMLGTIQDVYNFTGQEDFYSRSNAEETQLHGDPSIVLNTHAKPDYAIEDPMVKITPGFISVADGSFRLNAKTINLGRAPSTPVVMEIKRQYPNGTTSVILRDSMVVKYADSVIFDIPIDPIKDKGLNKIIVTIDSDNIADELYETNNTITRDVMIYEDEARPVFPYNFAIINTPTVVLKASTANPFSAMRQYTMEMDTTEKFNSPSKISQTLSSIGGILEFNPGITFNSGTVYYWRVGTIPNNGPMTWNTASFIYLAGAERGFNQSHFNQHQKSSLESMVYDSARHWNFGNSSSDLFIRNGVFPTAASFSVDFSVAINGDPYIRSVCGLSNIIFNVIDPNTFKPWINGLVGQPAKYGSDPICGNDRRYNFQFNIMDTAKRRKAMEFLDLIPAGHYVIARNTSGTDPNSNTYASTWANDTTYFGSGNSMYHRLKGEGFVDIDSFHMPRAFAFVYRKGALSTFTPKWSFSQGLYDKITVFTTCETKDTIGYIKSPIFGPAVEWKQLLWNGTTIDTALGDYPLITILGTKQDGTQDTVMTDITMGMNAVDIWGIPAQQYPYLQIIMRNADSVHYTPYQLDYWRLTYEPAPEGAVAPNIFFSMRDTVDVAEPLQFRMAFKNISEAPFADSLKVKVSVTDRNNVTHVMPTFFHRPLPVNDTILVSYPLDTKLFSGINSLYVEVNPDNHQPEQYHFNNTFFRQFYVRPDTLNPLMDVTFDNVRILNNDIVSASPDIMIKLKDESKWYMLQDTSRVSVKIRFPDNSLKDYYFNGTDLIYLGPGQAPNTDNTATVNLKPKFSQDGTYELIVTGKDMSENRAGTMEYRVAFQVYNKPMISNMLNYPNPFTTSTAFVFTITGSEVPQNIRIQILTVTGKVVREITKDELGPLHIGRNITDFKWDGTDQYGQKLANGVYLYRVITNLNGKSLDKFENGDNTDRFFNKGYGKMYLMR